VIKLMPSSSYIWGSNGVGRTVLIAYAIGLLLGLGIGLALLSESWVDFGLYLIALSFFHLWEYLYVCLFHPSSVSAQSFMVNHSPQFNIALAASFVEYLLESKFFPSLKGNTLFIIIGFIALVLGQALRTTAMITAGRNFNHIIQSEKADDHKLVTDGIYSFVRHPSYTGWFIWSIATQVLLFNPLCIGAYAYASWMFFRDRIEYEEETLVEHFGKQYEEYRKRVPSGIPLVK